MSNDFGGPVMPIAETKAEPVINVTPLIDVLLVLLIIFMVAAPMRPHKFETKLPSPPDRPDADPNPHTLVVTIEPDGSLRLNELKDMGTVDDPAKLQAKLIWLFAERTKNRAYRFDMAARNDLPDSMRIEKTVFIKAPRNIPYGEVARLIDGVKGTGAAPIGLQLDGLN
jgi:biopolymer transport protein ExbD